jgi:MscS family membrane protein
MDTSMWQAINNWIQGGENLWILQVFLVVFATVLTNFVLRRVLRRTLVHARSTSNPWDDAFVSALKTPALLCTWVAGLSIAIELVAQASPNELFAYVGTIRRVALILLLMLLLVRFVQNVENNFLARKSRQQVDTDPVTIRVMGRLLRVSAMITGVLVILQTLGISISGVVAFGGIGGIAVGFAAKDLLANFFGGLMIYLDRPFTVGDWIRSPDREIEGTVEDIGWRLTRIRTFDKRPLYIPNSVFTTIAVENPSRMLNRRIKESFGLRYADAGRMASIIKAVRTMLRNHPAIDGNATLIVNFDTVVASSLSFFIYTFTTTVVWTEYHEVKQDILLKVIAIIHDHGAELAFPTRTLDGLPAIPAETQAAASRSEADREASPLS